MYTRLRLINANQGHLVQIYYDESAKSQDPPTQKSPLWISTHSEKSHGKFEENKVSMYIFDPIGYLNVKAAIYLVTFVLRFLADIILYFCRKSGKISKITYYFVQYSYLLHINLFKMMHIEIALISTRTIFHSKSMPGYNFLAIVTMVFLAYDFCEIAYIAVTKKGIKEKTEDS